MPSQQGLKISEADVSGIQSMIRQKLARVMSWNLGTDFSSEDLAQEVFLRIWPKLEQYDPSRSKLLTFASRVADSAIQDIWRSRFAKRRTPSSITHEADFRIDEFSDEMALDPSGRDICMDVQAEIERLPSTDLQQLAEGLKDSSVSELAEQAGLNRGSLYRKVKQIKKYWKQSDLHHYVSDLETDTESARQTTIEFRKNK